MDRTAELDARWSAFLSTLNQSGMIDYFTAVANVPLPDLRHPNYRAIYEAKRDSIIGIRRVFEQMLLNDVPYVPWTTLDTLERLKTNPNDPYTLERLSADALGIWDRCGSEILPFYGRLTDSECITGTPAGCGK